MADVVSAAIVNPSGCEHCAHGGDGYMIILVSKREQHTDVNTTLTYSKPCLDD